MLPIYFFSFTLLFIICYGRVEKNFKTFGALYCEEDKKWEWKATLKFHGSKTDLASASGGGTANLQFFQLEAKVLLDSASGKMRIDFQHTCYGNWETYSNTEYDADLTHLDNVDGYQFRVLFLDRSRLAAAGKKILEFVLA